MPGFEDVEASANAERGAAQTSKEICQNLEIDPDDPNEIIRALRSIDFKKWVVLDDFHYLPQETQRDFAAALKAFFDESDFRFVIIAVWRERNRILSLGDLALRCVSIDADDWKDDELLDVIYKGEQALNIRFPERLKQDLVKAAMGSVYIVQEVCLRLCQDDSIFETQAERTQVGRSRRVDPLIEDVIDQFTSQYKSFFINFSYGFQTTELEMYKWLLLPVIIAPSGKLKNGIPLSAISAMLWKFHPLERNLNAGNITQALKSVANLQAQQNIRPFILDYDESKRVLNIVDRSFGLWINKQDRGDLLRELGLPFHAYQSHCAN